MGNMLVFLLILGALVSFHEFGHLIVAKACGMKIDSYSIGFGKVLFKFKIGETEYRISAIPLGGYVKQAGPNFLEDIDPNDPDKDRYFISKPVWQRALMVLAGPMFNFLFAIILASGIFYFLGVLNITTTVDVVADDSPAYRAGVRKGDVIMSVNDEKISDWRDIVMIIQSKGNEKIKFGMKREDKIYDIFITPETKDNRLMVGIAPAVERQDIGGIIPALTEGTRRVAVEVLFQAKGFMYMFQKKIPSDSLGGPVMIYQVTKQAADEGIIALIGLMILLNVALGFFNLLPIPPLDGGHLLFLAIEVVIGKPVGKNAQMLVQMLGFGLMLLVMLFATKNDLARLFHK